MPRISQISSFLGIYSRYISLQRLRDSQGSYLSGGLQILDGLRGLAAIYVLLHHTRATLWAGWADFTVHKTEYSWVDMLVAWCSFIFSFGPSAVLLFFVIS